ncbi:MAG: cell division protein ZapA [Acidobacteriota bacterium]
MNTKATTSVDVEIFGQVYQVRGEHDRDHLHHLASVVDQRMRDIGERTRTVDSGRIAILTALNLADELHQCATQQDAERAEIMDDVTSLTDTLAQVLDP